MTTSILIRCECGCGNLASPGKRFICGHNISANPSYGAIHRYLRTHNPKTGICDECGLEKRTEFALIKGRQYSRNREDYRELCKKCHNNYDGIAPGGLAWKMGRVRRGARGFEGIS
jgi:hypothetical protein